MRLSRLSAAFLIALILLVGCNLKGEQVLQMPEKMPGDFDFSVRFGITSKNVIDTFEDKVTKDLIAKGTVTTDFAFTDDEMKSIYDRMKDINILRGLELVPKTKSCMQTPYPEDYWEIMINGEIRSFYWSEENCSLTKDARKLKELREFVFNIVKNNEKYKSLPEAVGGYD